MDIEAAAFSEPLLRIAGFPGRQPLLASLEHGGTLSKLQVANSIGELSQLTTAPVVMTSWYFVRLTRMSVYKRYDFT